MYDELLLSKYKPVWNISWVIEIYLDDSNTAEQFYSKNRGANYDGSIMRLQALGELLKNIAQKYPFVIDDLNYPELDNLIRFRDFVSHHYELLEHETIFEICRLKIPELKRCIAHLLQ